MPDELSINIPMHRIELAGWGKENGVTLESIALGGASIRMTIGKEEAIVDCNLLFKSVAVLTSPEPTKPT